MGVCPSCNTKLVAEKLKVEFCDDHIYLQKVLMISCPNCDKVLGFASGEDIRIFHK
jgi:uncharacterized protein with PIN domain